MATKPATAKKPADHQAPKPKVEKVEVTVGDGEAARSIPARRVTLKGLTLTVQERALQDYRIVKLFARQGERNAVANVQALDIMLGAEQHDQVAALFQDEDGYVDQEAVGEYTMELFKALAPNS